MNLNSIKAKLPHRSVTLAGIAVAFSLFGDMTIYAVLPIYYQNLGLTALQVGILLSANRWVRLITNHVAERVSRKVHPGLLLTGSLALGSLLAALYAATPPFLVFLLGRILWGLCWSFLRQIGTMTSLTHSTDKTLGFVIGFYNALVRLGYILGSFLGGLLFDTLGYRLVFLVMSGITFIGIPSAAAALPGKSRERAAQQQVEAKSQFSLGIMLRGFAVGCVGSGIIMSTLGLILKHQLGISLSIGQIVIGVATINGVLLASRQVLFSIGSPLLGGLLDRTGLAGGELIFFLVATGTLFLAALFPRVAILLPLILIFFACETSITIALIAESGKRGSRSYAFLATAMDSGSALGPLLAWTVFELISNPIVTLFIAALFYSVGSIFSFVSYQKLGYSKLHRSERKK